MADHHVWAGVDYLMDKVDDEISGLFQLGPRFCRKESS